MIRVQIEVDHLFQLRQELATLFEALQPAAQPTASAPPVNDPPAPDVEEAEVVEVKTKSKTKAPAKKATKGAAQKKNEAQARAAAKAKAAEQEAESGDLGLDDAPPPAPVVTKQDVDKALRAYAGQYQMTGARALIALFKKSDGTPIANARELREEDYAAFVAAAQKPPVLPEA